jgi:hypothetical protein
MFAVNISSFTILFNHKLVKNPTTIPNNGPPNPILTKFPITYTADEEFPFANSIKSKKNTIAVPSFNKD